jgi:hypothetical protein
MLETPSKDLFVDTLVDSEVRVRIKQPKLGNLNETIKLVVECMSHLRATLADAGKNTNSLSAILTRLTEKFYKLQKDLH